jgi:catalase
MGDSRRPRQPALGQEYPPPDEQTHIDSLIRQLRAKMERDYAGSRTLRDAHPKMHGCVRGEFSIQPNLPEHLRIGIFARLQTFPAWVRFSNASGTVSPDSKGDLRGVAIKLMAVAGQKLEMSGTDDATHDFILISDSRFVTKDVAQFDGLVAALTGGPVKVAWFFLTHPRAARNLWFSMKRFSNPLGIRYFSMAPYLLGSNAVKYSLIPQDALHEQVPNDASADSLREAMVNHLSARAAVFDFSVQLQMDPDTMPIEDLGITWDEASSPFQKVATLTIAQQLFDTSERREFGDNLSFNPWRCLPEHRPLGGISRARRQVYQALSAFRHECNGAPRVEPTVDDQEWKRL